MENLINHEVDVTAYYFSDQAKKCFPQRIESNGQIVALLESGLRCLVKTGQRTIEIFTMSDGSKQYNLRHELDTRSWTLLSAHAL